MPAIAGIDDHRAANEVGLRAGLDVGARRLGDHRRREGGEEAPHHELVDPPLRALEGVRVDRLRGIDRRMVGGLLLAPGRGELALEQRRGGIEVRDPHQRRDELAGVQRARIHRVVRPRVGDEAVHVQVLGDLHRAGGSDAQPAGSVGGEGGRVVGRRWASRVALGVDLLDDAGRLGACERGVCLGLLPELVGGVMRLECAIGMLETGQKLPVGLGDVGATLELALYDQRQGGALNPADGEEVRAEAPRGQRDGAGQRGAPDQVDVLTGRAGIGEVVGEVVEVVEGALDLGLGQCRVPGAVDRGPRGQRIGSLGPVALAVDDRGVRLDDLLERLEPDQLPLPVIVRGDHDLAGLLGQLADRLDHVLVGGLLGQLRVDQLVQVGLLPVRVAIGERRVHDVSLQAHRHLLLIAVRPGVERHFVGGVRGRAAAAQDVGDLLR